MLFGRSGVGEVRIDTGSITSTDYGYTFQRVVADTGLIDYKARAYDPWLGRFIQPDTIVPGAGNSQAYNRYSYVNNNPIKFIDPSGHKICIYYDENGNCVDSLSEATKKKSKTSSTVNASNSNSTSNPDVTLWLYEAIITEPNWIKQNVDDLFKYDYARVVFTYGSHLLLFGNFARYDVKRKMYDVIGEDVVLCGINGCKWVDYSAPGNILYGYLSASRGIPQSFSWLAGGALEIKGSLTENEPYTGTLAAWGDNPGDKAGVDFGYELFSKYPNGMTFNEFQSVLTSDVINSLQPSNYCYIQIPQPTTNNPYFPGAFLN